MSTAAEIMGDAAAIWMPIDDLVPWGENPRRIPESAVRKVAIGMCSLGYGAPGIIRAETKRLVAGHTRRRAFLSLLDMVEKHGLPPEHFPEYGDELGEVTLHHRTTPAWADKPEEEHPPEWYQWMKDEMRNALAKRIVPVRAMDLTEQEADAMALADNRLGEEAEWDQDLLASVLKKLPQDDHLLTGFDPGELEPLLAYIPPEPPELPETPTPPATPGSHPLSHMVLRLDPGQRAAVETGLEAAREHWERPDMPAAEFVAELARKCLEGLSPPTYPETAEEPAPNPVSVTPSTGMCDF